MTLRSGWLTLVQHGACHCGSPQCWMRGYYGVSWAWSGGGMGFRLSKS